MARRELRRDGRARAEVREQSGRSEPVEKTEEDRKIGTPGEEAEDERPTRSKDLRRHEDHAVHEGPVFHAQNAFAVGLVSSAPNGT